jgi:RNA polymerase sigma-70 factor (subfamily 1)
MATDPPATPADLERFRPYLRLIARLHLPAALRGKLDPSDVVQDALVKALRHLDQYRGRSEEELAGWLRQTLATTLANAARDWARGKRDAGREVPLERQVHDSSARLEAVLAADQTSPSLAAVRHEDLLRLAAAPGGPPGGPAGGGDAVPPAAGAAGSERYPDGTDAGGGGGPDQAGPEAGAGDTGRRRRKQNWTGLTGSTGF